MSRVLGAILTVLLATGGSAQQIEVEPLDPFSGAFDLLQDGLDLNPEVEELRPEATVAPGATVRLLDRVTGQLEDLEMQAGQTARLDLIDIVLSECRYPTGNPSGDAFAYLAVTDRIAETEIFSGWMIASSPALNALDHPRFDVWVLRCKTS